jgi:hypothetical protein
MTTSSASFGSINNSSSAASGSHSAGLFGGRSMASRIPSTPVILTNQFTICLSMDNYLYWRT